jgi:hypothetical protein
MCFLSIQIEEYIFESDPLNGQCVISEMHRPEIAVNRLKKDEG